jgi:arylsulfatase A-like enzyme
LLPEAEYLRRAGPDSPPWEDIGKVTGDTNAFPHTITGGAGAPNKDFYSALDYSPFTNDILVNFSEQVILNEQLGGRGETDVLTVSFSADDYVGHRFGPYSQEVMDVTLRVDRQIGALLDFVNAHVGLSNTLVVFTADHGMGLIPEHAATLGLDGARIKAADVLAVMRSAISVRYNSQHKSPDPSADYVFTYTDNGKPKEGFINGNLYFNTAALRRDGVNLEEIERIACDAAMSVKGIARCYTRAQLLRGELSVTDPVERRVLHGFNPERSGDLIVVQQAFKYLSNASDPATHGTPYSYDTHVPMIIMGKRFVPGRYLQAASPADIAPTLAALLGIQPPSNSTGRILAEAVR